MRDRSAFILIASLLVVSVGASAQAPAKLAFDVASVRPSPPPDIQKMMQDLQAGKRPESVHIEGSRATFTYQSLKHLIAYAYKLPIYEVSGPDWMIADRFDIAARMPDGGSKDDVPPMLMTLLQDRFKLEAHHEMQDQPVLGLMVLKSGPKLKQSTGTAAALDEAAPLKPGESMMDTATGPVRLTKNADGSTTYNMGTRGSFTLKFDGASLSMHMEASHLSMAGFAIMMTSLGGGEGRQVVDMTALPGNYEAGVDFSLMDLMSSLHDQGIDIPTGPPGGGAGGSAADPGGGETVSDALEKLGLKLEKSRAKLDRLVVDHVEKAATEN